MKLMFLDFDGVLNSRQSALMFHNWRKSGILPDLYVPFRNEEFCPICSSNLVDILEEFDDLKIVVSSTWRIGAEISELKEILFKLGVPKDRVIDKTPLMYNQERGDEIAYWLNANGHQKTPYVVIDDDADMTMVWDNFIQTDNSVGLDYIIRGKVIEHFKDGKNAESTKKEQLAAS